MEQQKPRIIQLPKIEDERGNLSFIEGEKHLPFRIERTYWIYDVPGGQFRGSHAFRTQHELIVALSGSFDVILNDGSQEYVFSLNRSYRGVYVPPMTWRRLDNFSTNSLCLVLSSGAYDAAEYIEDFEVFRKELNP
ncbi:MAG: FdtA/QdtA family cupin domain-containing protein [Bacteroidales bacterium]